MPQSECQTILTFPPPNYLSIIIKLTLRGDYCENGPFGSYWNLWSPVNGTVWEGLEGVALLGEVCLARALYF